MKRRSFIQKSVLTGSFLGLGGAGWCYAFAKADKNINLNKNSTSGHFFNLKYAPRLDIFKKLAGEDPLNQLKFMATQGFTAFEDDKMRVRPREEQEAIAQTMTDLSMTIGTFVAHKIYWTEPNLTSGKKKYRDEFLKDIRESVVIARRVDAKWITVVPGYIDGQLDMSFQTENVIEILKQATAILEPEGITMLLEPLYLRNDTGLFLSKSSQAYEICKAVGSGMEHKSSKGMPSEQKVIDTYIENDRFV